jgi:hypothetical protein
MTEYPVPDCLVLKIEGVNINRSDIETTIYVLYDKKDHNYVIRGKRSDSEFYESKEYSFICEELQDVIYFITFVVSKKNLWSYTLYNYDSLPVDSNDISFEYMHNNDYADMVLAMYENKKYNRHILTKNLRMLRNVFNYYN